MNVCVNSIKEEVNDLKNTIHFSCRQFWGKRLNWKTTPYLSEFLEQGRTAYSSLSILSSRAFPYLIFSDPKSEMDALHE
jgi:hypothetical protein